MAKRINYDRQRGSLVDAITLAEFPFQFEPEVHKDKDSNTLGEHHIVGHRLPNYHWVGGGKSELELDLYLLSAAMTNFSSPKPDEVGAFRMAQLGDYQRMILVDTGENNADGSAKMKWVKNPEPPPKVDSVGIAKRKIREAKQQANRGVMQQIADLKKFCDPQDDIGAPHPVLINLGGLYTGIQWLVSDVETTYLSRNLETLEPYEAQIKLKLVRLAENAKYTGTGVKK